MDSGDPGRATENAGAGVGGMPRRGTAHHRSASDSRFAYSCTLQYVDLGRSGSCVK